MSDWVVRRVTVVSLIQIPYRIPTVFRHPIGTCRGNIRGRFPRSNHKNPIWSSMSLHADIFVAFRGLPWVSQEGGIEAS